MTVCLTQDVGLITLVVGIINVIALFSSPIVALWMQKKIEAFNKKKQRQLNIFKTLLATRSNPTSLEHVEALNMIDIEFYKEKNIRDAWNTYRKHLNSCPQNQDEQAQKNWKNNSLDYLTNLLFSMSTFFGYDFDKIALKEGEYSPILHYWKHCEETLIRSHLIKVLDGKKAIKVELSQKNTN